ncbi:MAG: TonB-dependent receptor, partial [Porticoccaceae bacterium]|nr:TonB-dependent receptor [Porticoccaceae bacterium]
LQRGSDGIYTVMREQTEIDGLEFRTTWMATEADTLGLRYAHTDGRYDSNDDGKVDTDLGGANISPDRVNLNWDRRWSEGISSRLQVNHVLDRDFDNSAGVTTNEFNGYTTVDISADFAALAGNITVAIQNLNNRDYFTYYSQTSPNDIRNFKGLGRTFTLGYQKSF